MRLTKVGNSVHALHPPPPVYNFSPLTDVDIRYVLDTKA